MIIISVLGVEEGVMSFLIRFESQEMSFCLVSGVMKEEKSDLRSEGKVWGIGEA